MGGVVKGIGKALGHIAGQGLTTITGGALDGGALLTKGKLRIAAPLSGKAVRNFAGGISNALSLGLAEKQIDGLLNTKEAKLAGTGIGAAVGAGTAVGAGASLLNAGGAAAGSIGGTAGSGLNAAALSAAPAAGAAGAGGLGSGTALGLGAAAAGLAKPALDLVAPKPQAPTAPEVEAPPTPDEIARKLEEDRASAEASARSDRSRRVSASYRNRNKRDDEEGIAAIESKRAVRRSVLG